LDVWVQHADLYNVKIKQKNTEVFR